jgi:outer membrane protein insertion porin family
MLATRTFVFAALVVGIVGTARAQPAQAPPTTDAGAAPSPPTSPPPPPTGIFYVGGSYATDVGYTLDGGVSQSNLFHTGNALSLDASFGQREQRYDMKLVDPHLASGRLTLTVEAYNDRRLLGATDVWRQAVGVDVSLSTPLADHARAFVGYRIEDVQTTGVIAWLRAGTDYNTLDHAAAPTRGTSAGVTASVGKVNGDDGGVDLVRVDAWFDTHQPLGPFIFHTGGKFSAVGSPNGNVPFTEMMFFGGPTDIRGFGYGQGPGATEPSDIIATWRSELELPVTHGVSVRGLWDVGTMLDWNGSGILAQSVGGGVLWRSPIGPISLDYAVPFVGTGPHWLLAFGRTF